MAGWLGEMRLRVRRDGGWVGGTRLRAGRGGWLGGEIRLRRAGRGGWLGEGNEAEGRGGEAGKARQPTSPANENIYFYGGPRPAGGGCGGREGSRCHEGI